MAYNFVHTRVKIVSYYFTVPCSIHKIKITKL